MYMVDEFIKLDNIHNIYGIFFLKECERKDVKIEVFDERKMLPFLLRDYISTLNISNCSEDEKYLIDMKDSGSGCIFLVLFQENTFSEKEPQKVYLCSVVYTGAFFKVFENRYATVERNLNILLKSEKAYLPNKELVDMIINQSEIFKPSKRFVFVDMLGNRQKEPFKKGSYLVFEITMHNEIDISIKVSYKDLLNEDVIKISDNLYSIEDITFSSLVKESLSFVRDVEPTDVSQNSKILEDWIVG